MKEAQVDISFDSPLTPPPALKSKFVFLTTPIGRSREYRRFLQAVCFKMFLGPDPATYPAPLLHHAAMDGPDGFHVHPVCCDQVCVVIATVKPSSRYFV